MKSVFVFNPESGDGKLKKHQSFIVEKLSEKFGEIDVIPTTHSGHAKEVAQQSIGVYDHFFVAGGDGTLNEVINGFGGAENKPTIGYIPCGTVNDVARSLGLTKNIKKSVKNIIEGQPFKHDIFRVNDRFGIYVCCTGLFTKSSYDTSRKNKKRFGKIAYFFKGAKEIFSAKPVHVEIETETEKINRNCSLALILNSRSVAGFKLNKDALLNDGEVEVVLFHSHEKRVKFSEIFRAMSAFAFGLKKIKQKENKKITYRKLSKFTLNAKEGTIINLDGEKSGAGSFNFEVIKEAVEIIVPPKKGNGKKS